MRLLRPPLWQEALPCSPLSADRFIVLNNVEESENKENHYYQTNHVYNRTHFLPLLSEIMQTYANLFYFHFMVQQASAYFNALNIPNLALILTNIVRRSL
jgi:hypothetical protein